MPIDYPPYIFGMHDRGGEHLMLEKNRRGWVLVTEELGADPNNANGSNYTDLTNKGLGVIVRLNHGYGSAGTIPHSSQYDNFARRCGNFCQASPGCRIWIIGNEMNLANERPGGPNGQVITPQLYADCFRKCRSQIRSRPGHADDQVVIGSVAPWNPNTKYSGNPGGDWVQYFRDVLNLLGDAVDGISIHTYTHGQDPNFVFSDAKMNPPFQNYHWHFRTYRDFMNTIPPSLRDRPVYITETDMDDPWLDAKTGWVQNAYREINDWNKVAGQQPIQAVILYRWIIGNPNDPKEVGWAIVNKPGVQDDFRAAMNNDYRVILPQSQPAYLAAWLEVSAPGRFDRDAEAQFSVKIRNDGRQTWATTGSDAVRLGHRWIDAGGAATEGARTALPSAVAPGQTVSLPAATVRAPTLPGYYTLELDLVQGASGWFAQQGSPTWKAELVRVGDRYRIAWLNVAAPASGKAGETVTFPVRMRNDGAETWTPNGDRPFNLTYKWLTPARQEVVADGLRTPLPGDVAPGQEVAVQASVQLPAGAGDYLLLLDLVQERVTWFHWKGSPPHEIQVKVRPAVPDYAAEWLEYVGPQSLQLGEAGIGLVRVKNSGAQPWPKSGAGAVRLGYRWLNAQGQAVAAPGARTWPLSANLQPGETATFRDVEIVPPGAAGAYRLVWDLARGGDWLSAAGVAVKEVAFQVMALAYNVAWEVLTPWPRWMPPGEEQKTSLRLRNIGTAAWPAGGSAPVVLAYNWFTADGKTTEPWDTFRTRLPRNVAAGESVDLVDIAFKTPPLPGRYTLRWDLLREGFTWFFRQGGTPLEVPVEVSDQASFVPWSGQASHNPGDVALAFDGDPDTAWDSGANQEPGLWFQVDLGEVRVLDRVKVASPGRGFPSGYKVLLSEDGQAWRLVAQKKPNWSDIDVAFAPAAARYLRLEQTGTPNWATTWKIAEIAVSATELWAGAEASHYSDDAGRAVDARLDTAWNTRNVKQKPGLWLQVDLGAAREIERIVVESPKNQQPRGYVVQVSTDGQSWQEMGRKDDNWGSVDVEFPATSIRLVRVETTNSSQYHPWGVSEFIVWRSSPQWLRGRAG